NIYAFDDLPVEFPIVGYTKRANLRVTRAMAVQKQQVGNPVIALSDCDAFIADHRNTSHHDDGTTLLLEVSHVDGVSRSVEAPRCTIAGFSTDMARLMSRTSEVSSNAEPLDDDGMAENISRASSIMCSRGNEPSPTNTPMWSTPSSPRAAAS